MTPDKVKANSDSLIGILAEQCADLERLLALARREAEAAAANDFAEVFRIVGERASVGERLEVFHRQLAELRARLGDACTAEAERASLLASEIQAQDALTRPLLLAAKAEAAASLRRFDEGRRNASAYLRAGTRTPVACDSHA